VAYRYRDETLVRVHWRVLDQAQDSPALVRVHWRVLDQAQDSPALERPLLGGVKSVDLRFLDQRLQWQSAWPPEAGDDPARLPRAVEITLDVAGIGPVRRLFRVPPGEALLKSGGGA